MSRIKRNRFFCLLLTALLLFGASACGASQKTDNAFPELDAPQAASDGFYGDINYGSSESVVMPAEEPQAAADASFPQGVKMIYTADIALETTAFESASAGIEQMVTGLGGYLENHSLYSSGSYRSAYYTARIPSASFDLFCTQIGSLAQIDQLTRTKDDISETYYDTEARLTTQNIKLERLQALLAKAEEMEDIISLESAISETEYQIEQLTGSLRHYDALVDFSTVSISLCEVGQLRGKEQPAIGFGAQLSAAFRQGTKQFVIFLQDFTLGFARGWIGWCLLLAVLALLLFLLIKIPRRLRKILHRKVKSSPTAPENKDE